MGAAPLERFRPGRWIQPNLMLKLQFLASGRSQLERRAMPWVSPGAGKALFCDVHHIFAAAAALVLHLGDGETEPNSPVIDGASHADPG
jgi:hypothetical protein